MQETENVLDQAEMYIARILDMQKEGRTPEEPEVEDMLIATNILLLGILFCVKSRMFNQEQTLRAINIGKLFEENSNHFGGNFS